jgi:hypothetical protein
MRSEEMYAAVFSEHTPLTVWPTIVRILKLVDAHLTLLRPHANVSERFLRGWRYIVAFLAVAKILGKFNYSAVELAALDPAQITRELVEAIWRELEGRSANGKPMRIWASRKNVIDACRDFADGKGISGMQSLLSKLELGLMEKPISTAISDEFIESVRTALPVQPWKPGTRQAVVRQLQCSQAEFSAAVDRLIEDGAFLRQKDGVLYDAEGNVAGFDPERVDPQSFERQS